MLRTNGVLATYTQEVLFLEAGQALSFFCLGPDAPR